MKIGLHFLILILLTLGIFFTQYLSSFQTPFTGSNSDYNIPFETLELKRVLKEDQYRLIGPFGKEASSPQDRYIQPLTSVADIWTILFKYRVQLSYAFATLGILQILISRIYLRPSSSYFKLCHFFFCVIAFYVTMCTRWWGYG